MFLKREEGINLFRDIKDNLINFITSRIFVMIIIFVLLSFALIARIFKLQIVKGEEYLDNFVLMIQKDRSIPASRGNIYDVNGNILAYNDLAYSIKFEDVYESSSKKDEQINNTLREVIDIVDNNGGELISDFEIILNEDNEFEFGVTGFNKDRFLADIYGYSYIDDLKKEVKLYNCSAQDVINHFADKDKYEIGAYEKKDGKSNFLIGYGYTNEEMLKLIAARYEIDKNAYQKFISTTIASNISDKTVTIVMENSSRFQGVTVEEEYLRKYVQGEYFSHIIGYVASISTEEFKELNSEITDESRKYYINDLVGKSGIEKEMEDELRGINGSEIIHVDKMGGTINTSNLISPQAGSDLYLTIDKDLQIATYDILEKKLSSILLEQIVSNSEKYFTDEMERDKRISIDEVYFSFFRNNILSFSNMFKPTASEYEKNIAEAFTAYRDNVLLKLEKDLVEGGKDYKKLPDEYKIYQSHISNYVINTFFNDHVDKSDSVYIDWRVNETINIKDFLLYSISMNWIDVTKLESNSQYLNKEEIYEKLVSNILESLTEDSSFSNKILENMIKFDKISPMDIIYSLWKQGVIEISLDEYVKLNSKKITAYNFIREKIEKLEITPAQLALEPCSASCVITDTMTGDVLALVSYPSYDNNLIRNTAYYNKINNDLSRPLWNYATQQKTAPGSTYKLVSTATFLEEEVASKYDKIRCDGIFNELEPHVKCWIYPSAHGNMNATSAIENSCNDYFSEMMYDLCFEDNAFSSVKGIDLLSYYATMFGLNSKSGIEISEAEPNMATDYPIPASIGQSNHNYTTVGLASYVNIIANKGTNYRLTLLEKLKDSSGNLIKTYRNEVVKELDFKDSTWDVIHKGMELACAKKSFFNTFEIKVAGKTGTAQESANKANHALFIGYAPADNPEISISTRIANGYTSNYAAEATKDVLAYYFEISDLDNIINNDASEIISDSGSQQD